jgi:hypothetical protein
MARSVADRSEAAVRAALTEAKYQSFLNTKYPKTVAKDELPYWDPKTGSCGFHAFFTKHALGVKDVGEYKLVTLKKIPSILEALDKGEVLEFLHAYPSDAKFFDIPKDNRYGNHVFVLVKGGADSSPAGRGSAQHQDSVRGDKYFLSQGYLHKYKHSLTTFTRAEIAKMLEDIIEKHSDYEGNKTWADIDLSIHTKYFKVEARVFPDRAFIPTRKVNGIKLYMMKTKPI